MRTPIIATIFLGLASIAQAQEVVAPPSQPAPAAVAPLDERAVWCDAYATWLVEMAPAITSPAPPDVRDTHQLEVELNSCKIDPQRYERETRAEADEAVERAHG